MANALKYHIRNYIVSIHEYDQDAIFDVRRNGKAFYIEITPAYFINSPNTFRKYLSYLELLRSGEEVLGDIYDTDVFDWVMSPYMEVLTDLAPPPTDEIKISLQHSLYPEFFVFHSYVVDEKPAPRRIVTDNRPLSASNAVFKKDFVDELKQWTVVYEPAHIIPRFEDQQDALYKEPKEVFIETEAIECFYKACHSTTQAMRELKTYKAIADAGIDRQGLNIGRIYGVVMERNHFILGILVSYIDCRDTPLAFRVIPEEPNDPPQQLRRVWMQQLDDSLAALHKAGIVWGDVKAENVLIDNDNNAWITDFGGGYTPGWVDKELAGTVEGDLTGVSKIWKLLFPSKS